MKMHEEEASYRALQKQLNSRGVVHLALQCGVLAWMGERRPWDGAYIDGYSPRLLYYRFTAADTDAVRDLGWAAEVDHAWRAGYSPPEDCGPLPSLE